MERSVVQVSMAGENRQGFSYATVEKAGSGVLLVLKDRECGVYPLARREEADFAQTYLLLKHYPTADWAYRDFLKLIGKMCKKSEDSKYFLRPVSEDNRMVCQDWEHERALLPEEEPAYRQRLIAFQQAVDRCRDLL